MTRILRIQTSPRELGQHSQRQNQSFPLRFGQAPTPRATEVLTFKTEYKDSASLANAQGHIVGLLVDLRVRIAPQEKWMT